MTKFTKEIVDDLADKLLIGLNNEEIAMVLKEFETIDANLDLVNKIEGIEDVEPMTFPYVIYHASLREDEAKDCLTNEEVLANAKETKANQVKVPKVVK